MKTLHLKHLWLSLVAGLSLLGAGTLSHAQTLTTSWTNSLDNTTGAGTGTWCWWYDMYQQAYGFGYNALITNSFDSTMNSTLGPAGSGSLVYFSYWPGVPQNTGKGGQTLIYGTFGGGNQFDTSKTIDATKYDSLSFDLYVDPSSPLNQVSNVCNLTVGFFLNNYNTYTITNATIGTNNFGKWVRYVCPINKATAPTPPAALPAGPMFNINCYGGQNANLFTNTIPTKMWIDNLVLTLSKVKSPPPVLSSAIIEPKAGLNLFSSSASSDQYQRTSIKLLSTTGVGWLGQSDVTYSFNITNFPSGATYPGYQGHIFITTGAGNNSGLDYAEANVIFFDVHQNPNGTAYGAFRYKINEPQANSNMFGAEFTQGAGLPEAGTLAVLGAPSILGTWSLTFNQDTNVTILGPGGASTNFNMRPEAVANFVEPLNVVFGGQPNSPGNVGQDVVLASASVTNGGAASSIVNDNFMADTFLDTGTWTPLAAAANTVQLFPYDPGQKLVKWTLPDVGFGLQTTTNLAAPISWTTLTGNEATGSPLVSFSANGFRNVLVPSADLGPNQNFFRLFTRNFTKLQVLMPGETAAPGTVSGKTGTPDPQVAGQSFIVKVNAVDSNWRLATSADDLVHLSSTDVTATLPADTFLSGGTVNLSVTFGTAGTYTITASDVTDGAKTANTGSPTQAN